MPVVGTFFNARCSHFQTPTCCANPVPTPYRLLLCLVTDTNRFSATCLLSYILLYLVCTTTRTKGCTDWQGPITVYDQVPNEAS
jgi:hypothetical protein